MQLILINLELIQHERIKNKKSNIGRVNNFEGSRTSFYGAPQALKMRAYYRIINLEKDFSVTTKM